MKKYFTEIPDLKAIFESNAREDYNKKFFASVNKSIEQEYAISQKEESRSKPSEELLNKQFSL